MKKILLITMSILLAACGVVQPVQQEQPTPVIQTVVVTVIPPTEIVPPTAVPTEIPPTAVPTETLVPTLPPQPTEALPTVDPATSNNGLVPVNVGNDLGKGVFINITFSSDIVSLRCFPREMQITITPNLQDIREAVMYYRIVDKPAGLYPSEWQNLGEMQEDSNGNFIFTFKGETIHPNFRVLEEAWIDFQFIGINRGGGVVDRTQKIERLVTYYKDCP
ncbi:MAG TPA: hypothetical protein PLX90_11635 [Anaerolineales bacterium]|nr:hypothetical protein [Anaerolineales bacterium]